MSTDLRSLRPPVARLVNTGNYCYMNSVAQALYWMGELSCNASLAYGGARQSFALLQKSSSVDLTESLLWRRVLRQWPEPLRQHDVGEFARHVLTLLQPRAITAAGKLA